jgi:hypothetical protein
MSVRKKRMRHASIQTTMDVYGKAMADTKRQAHSNVVEMLLKGGSLSTAAVEHDEAKAAIGS